MSNLPFAVAAACVLVAMAILTTVPQSRDDHRQRQQRQLPDGFQEALIEDGNLLPKAQKEAMNRGASPGASTATPSTSAACCPQSSLTVGPETPTSASPSALVTTA